MTQQKLKENLLLFGATGYIGAYIIEEIVKARESFDRVAIFTSSNTLESKSQKLDELKRHGVEVIIGDVKKSGDLLDAFQGLDTIPTARKCIYIHAGIDTIISAVGRNGIAEQIESVKLAIQAPTVKRFFPSEYGTDVEYGPESVNEIPHQQKLKVRMALRESSGLDYTYVVTGPYADGRAYLSAGNASPKLGSFNVKEKTAVLLGDGNGKISLTTPPE